VKLFSLSYIRGNILKSQYSVLNPKSEKAGRVSKMTIMKIP